jgi:hypothetical protein
MASSGMLHGMALVRTDVWEELRASIVRVTGIGELGRTLAVTSNRRKQRHPDDGGAKSLRKSVLKRATRRNVPENVILQFHNYITRVTGTET